MITPIKSKLNTPGTMAAGHRFGALAPDGLAVPRAGGVGVGDIGFEPSFPDVCMTCLDSVFAEFPTLVGIGPQRLWNASDSASRGSPTAIKGRARHARATIAPQNSTSVSSTVASSQFGCTPWE